MGFVKDISLNIKGFMVNKTMKNDILKIMLLVLFAINVNIALASTQSKESDKMIYFDHNATTIAHEDVKKLAISLMGKPLNPSSIHTNGREARAIVEKARRQVAKSTGIGENSKDYQITFTSCGTESDNWIISNYSDGDVFISSIEHAAILEETQYLPSIKKIKVNIDGLVDLDDLRLLLSQSKNPKKLVSVMMANNETGVIQPIKEIVKIAKEFGAQVHSDCVQSFGKIELNIVDLGIDFVTISAHKIGGLQGAAALIAKSEFALKPMIVGGGQEKKMRSGTENVLAIAGFGLASELAQQELEMRANKMRKLQKRLEDGILKDFPQVKIIGSASPRLPNTSLIIAPSNSDTDTQGKIMKFDLKGFAVSSGSACSAGKIGKSLVLMAMGVDYQDASSAIRVSLSHYNSEAEIDAFIKTFKEIYSSSLKK
jgi:cysteine desulfurase